MQKASSRALTVPERRAIGRKLRNHTWFSLAMLAAGIMLVAQIYFMTSPSSLAVGLSLIGFMAGAPVAFILAFGSWRKRLALKSDLEDGIAERFEGVAELNKKFAARLGITEHADGGIKISWFERLPVSGWIVCTDRGEAALGVQAGCSMVAATGHGGYSVPLADSLPGAPVALRRRHMSMEEMAELDGHAGRLRRERLVITVFTCLYAVSLLRFMDNTASSGDRMMTVIMVLLAFYNARTYYEQWRTAAALKRDIRDASVYIDSDREIEFLASSKLIWAVKDIPAGWRFVVSAK